MMEENGISILKFLILGTGGASCLLLVAGWVISLRKDSGQTCFIFAGAGMAGALLTLGLSWLRYVQGRAEIQEAIVRAGATMEAEMATARMGGVATQVTPGLFLAALSILMGTTLLLRGFLRLPRVEVAGTRPWSAIAVTILLSLGLALGLMAFADYLRFDDTFVLLLLLRA